MPSKLSNNVPYSSEDASSSKKKRKLTEEDLHYMHLIEELGNRWIKFFREKQLREECLEADNLVVNAVLLNQAVASSSRAVSMFENRFSANENCSLKKLRGKERLEADNLVVNEVLPNQAVASSSRSTYMFDNSFPSNENFSLKKLRGKERLEADNLVVNAVLPNQAVASSSRGVSMFDNRFSANENGSLKKLRGEEAKETKRSKPSGQKKRKVPKKSVHVAVISNEVTDKLKESIVNGLKGTDLKLVIQKTLYHSDTIQSQNRLNMPMNQLETDEFLTADEKRTLSKNVAKENEIEVAVFGPKLEYEMPMKLTMWHMAKTVNYVLKTRWFEFWVKNEEHLPDNSKIQVWSFRRGERLCFAVVCVEKPDVEDDEDED